MRGAKKRARGLLLAALATASLTAGTVAAAAPASADSCINGWFCLYYNSNGGGAFVRIGGNIPNLTNITFNACGTNCNGIGESVWNNAGSARNTNDFYAATVFYRFNYLGASDFVPTNTLSNLPSTRNEDASVLFGP
ncbi:peptidase inhibitor family I36 protein [Kitasatospora purpeofusca]|uniref:peptidase inhibitor family I36 protein n=1 Tax=Kitasatospora purpeofusca TaxID=67352 RepID=UPI0004BFC8DC|nr:peptidase inhibitor family I36 protein [Kitasatospora purpeofusca]